MDNRAFSIERQITDKQSPLIDDIFHNYGIYIYVVRDLTTQAGFFYLTTKQLLVGKVLYGYQLVFINHSLTSDLNLVKDGEVLRQAKRKSKIKINISSLWSHRFKETANPYKVKTDKIILDKKEWWLEGLPKNKGTTFLNKYKNGAVIDYRIENIIKAMMVSSKNLPMHLQSHCLVLTNGKTGKSSYIGTLGKNLDITSDAGIFGYYNTVTGQWNGGIITTTNEPIIIDEINELITKKSRILETINKPLENGSYTYGKAGGREICFNNMFLFLGNIDDISHFDSIISAISLNPSTIGRRFCYILYDNKLTLTKKDYSQIKLPPYTNKLRIYYGKILDKFLKSIIKAMSSKWLIKEANSFKAKAFNKLQDIELNNTLKFLKEYLSSSLITRLWVMAAKIAIFNSNGEIKQTSQLIDNSYKIFKNLLTEIEHSINNITNHLNDLDIEPYEQIKPLFNVATIYEKNAVIICYKNRDKFIQEKLFNKGLNGTEKELNRFKFYLNNLRRFNFTRANKLTVFGLYPQKDITTGKNIIRITNKEKFKQTCKFIENHPELLTQND